MKLWKKVDIIVYETVEDTDRIEYGGYVIQIYPWVTLTQQGMCHAIIGNENGNDVVVELDCLMKCIKRIDSWNKRGIKK